LKKIPRKVSEYRPTSTSGRNSSHGPLTAYSHAPSKIQNRVKATRHTVEARGNQSSAGLARTTSKLARISLAPSPSRIDPLIGAQTHEKQPRKGER